ncbi:MAG: hypothetical protein ACOX0F_09270 [Syntrophomonadaceae bacterium]|jgi:hypothetical protein
MDAGLIEKAERLLNANFISTTLSTVDEQYNVNVAVLTVLEMIGEDRIICARFGADRTYANLKQTGKGVFLVLLTDENQQTKDGIRVYVELEDDTTSGEYYERMKQKLAQTPYRQFPLKNCLVFKITAIAPVSTLKKK